MSSPMLDTSFVGGSQVADFTAEDFGKADSGLAGAKRTLGGSAPSPGKSNVKTIGGAPEKPSAPVFEEFDPPEKRKIEPFKPDDLAGPSLEYLFSPFEPGADPQEQVFVEMERPKTADYDFQDLDARDQNIINTLDRANKKAKEIVFDSFEQARRMEVKILDAAKAEAQELSVKLKSEAEREAAEIIGKAKAEAEEIKAKEAEAQAAREADVAKLADDMAAAEARKAELDSVAKDLDSRAKGLDDRKAVLDAAEAEMAARRGELEKKFQEDSAAALAQALAKGQADGFQKGRSEGAAKARGEVLAKAGGFFKIMDKIGDLYRELWRDQAPMMTTLAVEAAEAIVNKEIEGGRGLAAGALSACVEYLQKCHEVVFKVRSEDLQEVEAARLALRDRLEGLVNIKFEVDDSLGPGDLIMESDAGRLDATMKARRERIMAVLRVALSQGLVAELPPDDLPAPGAAPQGLAADLPPGDLPASGSASEASLPEEQAAQAGLEAKTEPALEPVPAPEAASEPKISQAGQADPGPAISQAGQAEPGPEISQAGQAEPGPEISQAGQVEPGPESLQAGQDDPGPQAPPIEPSGDGS